MFQVRREIIFMRGMVQVLSLPFIVWITIFLPAGTTNFWEAWVYWLIFIISNLLIKLYLLKYNQTLLKRRLMRGPFAEKLRDQKYIQLATGVLIVIVRILSGLDHRYAWSSIPTSMVVIADLFITVGFILIFSSFRENSFASSVIRVEKNQKIVTSGLYAYIRHPMYFGSLLLYIFTPIALGSWYALIPGFLLGSTLIFRLLNEEKYLLDNLKGYKAYKKNTPYRLIPYLW